MQVCCQPLLPRESGLSAEGLPSASFIFLGGLAKIRLKKRGWVGGRTRSVIPPWKVRYQPWYQLQHSRDFDLEVQETCMCGRIPHFPHSHGERGEKG